MHLNNNHNKLDTSSTYYRFYSRNLDNKYSLFYLGIRTIKLKLGTLLNSC